MIACKLMVRNRRLARILVRVFGMHGIRHRAAEQRFRDTLKTTGIGG